MPYELKNRLVVGIASSALFDLSESDAIFQADGEEIYRAYQEMNVDVPLEPGVAFQFIRRLLGLNSVGTEEDGPLVEVIILSRNDPDTGLRVLRSVGHHGLPITRSVFMQGKSPYAYIPAFNMSLFLSANERDVREALALGHPAGIVLPSQTVDDDNDDLRIAFDFDGVLADDESEQVYKNSDLQVYMDHEEANAVTPNSPGPLKDFLVEVAKIQKLEQVRVQQEEAYRQRLHIALVTARSAPANERAINTLKSWGVMVNDAFFLGGIDKGSVLSVLKPHIFFDDQTVHLESSSLSVASVHIPFGSLNEQLLIAES